MESNQGAIPGQTWPELIKRSAWIQAVLNTVVLGAWVWLYFPVLAYLGNLFTREEFRTNQILLIAILGLIGMRMRRGSTTLSLAAAPRFHPTALALALGGSLLYLLAERFLNINTLSAVLCGLASYGLMGLWLEPRRWRTGFPAMLLVVGLLPFGEHIETFLGYPARIVTARLVGDGLRAAGFPSVSTDTILIFESGISQVDLPCSGVKSLWTGMLFWLAATWIENRPLNLRWLLSGAFFGGLLLAANLARVGLLVAVGEVAGLRLAAEIIHVPLGVLGFVACCAAALALLRWQAPVRAPNVLARLAAAPAWLTPAIVGSVLLMALVYQPRPPEAAAQAAGAALTWQFPAELITQPAPMTPAEADRITEGGAETADRRRFTWNGLSGTLLLVTSRSWRAQHRPELCFEVYGFDIKISATRLVSPDFPIKTLELSSGNSPTAYQAAYWFQSNHRTTDDYATRIWADLEPQRERWVLVTVLWDPTPSTDAASLNAFYATLHTAVANDLSEGETQ